MIALLTGRLPIMLFLVSCSVADLGRVFCREFCPNCRLLRTVNYDINLFTNPGSFSSRIRSAEDMSSTFLQRDLRRLRHPLTNQVIQDILLLHYYGIRWTLRSTHRHRPPADSGTSYGIYYYGASTRHLVRCCRLRDCHH